MAASDTLATEAIERGQQIEVDGIPTHYHDAGEGPAVLLLHGSGPGVSAWANWRLVMPPLAQRFRVIAPDQLGYNQTGVPADGRYKRRAWTRHGLRLMEELRIERYSIVGNSMGGSVALGMTLDAPERVHRVVCMGSMGVSIPLPDGLDAVWGYEPSRDNMAHVIDLFAYDKSIATDELIDLRFRSSVAPGIQERYSAMFPPPRQRWVEDLAFSDAELHSIDQPVLLVHGWNDAVVPRETSLRLMNLLPDARLHAFGRCGHWVMIEHSKPFLRLLGDFLGE